MRVTGSLFTFTELSSSVADSTFIKRPSASLSSSNACVTVAEADAMVYIKTITGSSLRYPFYNELIPSSSVSGSSSFGYLSYEFTKLVPLPAAFTFVITVDSIPVVTSITDVPYTTIAVNNGSTINAYITLEEDGVFTCAGYTPVLSSSFNGVPYDNNSACPYAALGTYIMIHDSNWEIIGTAVTI
jgi:hypothetical protein